jgi:membrane protease YdiL (CAAX protease family)
VTKIRLPLSASIILSQSLLLGIGLVLREYFVGPIHNIHFKVTTESTLFALALSLPLIAFAMLLTSNLGHKFKPFYKIYAFIKGSPLGPFIAKSHLSVFVLFSIVAALGEEIIFRTVVQEKFGLFLSALVFAVIHPMTIYLMVVLFGAGLLFGFAYQSLESNLFVPFFAHAFYDLIVLVLMKRRFGVEPSALLK